MQSFPRFITKFKFLQFSGIPELLPPKEFHLLDHNVLESILFQTVPIPKPPLLQGSHGVHNFLRKCFLEPGFGWLDPAPGWGCWYYTWSPAYEFVLDLQRWSGLS